MSKLMGLLGMFMLLFALLLSAFSDGYSTRAQAQQSVQQFGNVTQGHATCWAANGVVQDCGVPTQTPYQLTSPLLTLTDSATVTPDVSQAVNFTWTLGATGRTLAAPVNLTSAYIGNVLRIYLIQDGTGNRTITSWGGVYKFTGGMKPTLSTGAGAVDRILCFVRTTTALDCDFVGNYQ